MTTAQITKRIELLEGQLAHLSLNAPLRYAAKLNAELRGLRDILAIIGA